EIIINPLDVRRLAIRREAHQFVFAGVDPETAVGGKRGVKEPERMRKTQLFQHLYLATITASNCGGGPFTNSIDRQNRRFRKWRRKEGAGRVRLMMFGEENR